MADTDYASSVGTGAASGAAAGSMVMPGWGTAIGAVVGAGLSLYGSMSKAAAAEKYEEAQKRKIEIQQQINEQRRQAMELDANRKQLEVIRNTQRVRAAGLQAATNQGAQFGSGLQGGLAQIQDQSLFNLSGINSSLAIGRNINQYNKNISADKMQMASLGGEAATDQAITSIGGSLMKIGPTVGSLSKGIKFPTGFGGPYV